MSAPRPSEPMATGPPAPTAMYFPPPPTTTAMAAGPASGPPVGPALDPAPSGPAGPTAVPTASPPLAGGDIRAARASLDTGLREYMSLQERRYRTDEVAMEDRLRAQAALLISDIRFLRNDIAAIVRAAESHRWRRWVLGTTVAAFIPAVRAIFRRPPGEEESANDTEYAFRKSKTLLYRIKRALLPGRGALAAVAFFVFAVLYVFQNEVTLRVGRTVSRRLKRLGAKLESGQDDVDESDLQLLAGWRWRVLLWVL